MNVAVVSSLNGENDVNDVNDAGVIQTVELASALSTKK